MPRGVVVGADGSVFIADTYNHRVRRIGLDGTLTTVAGSGIGEGSWGDGGSATEADLEWPDGVAVGPDGSVFLAEGCCVRRVDSAGVNRGTTIVLPHDGHSIHKPA